MNETFGSTRELTLSSGFTPLDEILEGPRWGDSVVFHLNNLREYCLFLEPLANYLESENIRSHYIHFVPKPYSFRSNHATNKIHYFNRSDQLEEISVRLLHTIACDSPYACFVLDNIADIGNIPEAGRRVLEFLGKVFAAVTQQGAMAYVALQKGFLQPLQVAQLKEQASIFIDVWSIDNVVYFQPLKVLGRYSERMFLRYQFHGNAIRATSGTDFEEYAQTLEQKSKEFLELYSQKRDVEKDLQKKIFELSLMNDITRSLLSTMNLGEILHRILVGVTAKEGLGFNRAFLLLVNETEQVLEGKIAIGPSSLDEALRIWTELNNRNMSFPELVSQDEDWQSHDVYVNELVRKVRVSLNERFHILIGLLRQMQPEILGYRIPSHHQPEELLQLLGVDCLAVAPLIYRKRRLGLLLADNLITQKEISEEDLKMLETFANYASSAIEHSRLYEEVRSRIKESERHIHELEAMQDRLLRSKKLSDLGELASKMAHEIRTPLVSIGGFSNSMLKREPPESEDYEYLKIIVEEVRRLEGIITDVLAYVSPGIPRRRTTNLRVLLDQVLVMLSLPLNEKQIEVDIHSDDVAVVEVDPDQMKQVFTIILNNAVESMSTRGRISIHLQRQESFFKVSVADTGSGIPHDKIDKVFDAFFTTKSTGSGLGLNIASQIITNHKGSIYVESELGVGSTFVIHLPLVTE